MSVPLPLKRGDGMPPRPPNEWVRMWQRLLNAKGYGPLIEDGAFGDNTQLATIAAQRSHVLPSTGRVDQATFDAVSGALHADTPTPSLQAFPDDPTPSILAYFHSGKVTGLPRHAASGHLIGLGPNGVRVGNRFLDIESDDDIDSDGVGASKTEDPDAQFDTSIHWPDGSACNSHTFCGFVLPKNWYQQFGIRLGDYGIVYYGGLWTPAQFYDIGPPTKIGETSIAATKALKQPANPRRGNSIKTLRIVVFAGSGNGFAVAPDAQLKEVAWLAGRLI